MDSSSSLFDMENTKILSKNVIFLSDLVEKVLDKEMGDAVFIPPFSFVYGPAFICLCIISHQCNASESIFIENVDIQDILIHQKTFTFSIHSFLHMQ